jgi:hypothetical protein
MASLHIAASAMTTAQCVDGGHDMVSRLKSRLVKSRRRMRILALSSILLTLTAGAASLAALNQRAANGTARLDFTIEPFKSSQKKQAAFDTWEFSKLGRVVQPPVPQPATRDLPARSKGYRP